MGVIHKKVGPANKRSQRAWRIEHSVDLQRENGLDRIKKKLCHKKN
jgi:hypothetical protein